MAVGTLDEYRCIVHVESLSFDFHLAETHLLWNHLQNVTLLVEERYIEGIEVGSFSGPFGRRWYGECLL